MSEYKKTQSQWVEIPQPLPPQVIKARSEIGVKEATNKNDGVPSSRYMGGRKEPWCAHFIAWVFRVCNLPIPNDVPDVSPNKANPLASVQYMEDTFKELGWWFPNGDARVGMCEPGDIVFYKNRGGSDSGPGRHVGLVERVDGGRIFTIEGNLGHSVKRTSLFATSKKISGFGRYDYTSTGRK